MKRILPTVALLLIAMFPQSAAVASEHGSGRVFVAHLTAAQEVQTPPVVSRATGRAVFSVYAHGTKIRFFLAARGLGRITMAHIHIGARGTNGPVSVVLFPMNTGVDGEGWSISGTVTASDITPTPHSVPPVKTIADLVRAIRAGDAYTNVHTVAHPAGEIRGQISSAYQG